MSKFEDLLRRYGNMKRDQAAMELAVKALETKLKIAASEYTLPEGKSAGSAPLR